MSVHASEIVEGARVWMIEVKDGRAIRWRPVVVERAHYLTPTVRTLDGKLLNVFASTLHWQPNARTDLPVEASHG